MILSNLDRKMFEQARYSMCSINWIRVTNLTFGNNKTQTVSSLQWIEEWRYYLIDGNFSIKRITLTWFFSTVHRLYHDHSTISDPEQTYLI
jgi:hypothetical protein